MCMSPIRKHKIWYECSSTSYNILQSEIWHICTRYLPQKSLFCQLIVNRIQWTLTEKKKSKNKVEGCESCFSAERKVTHKYLCRLLDYRPQTKFAKVMFLQVSVCPHGGRAWFYSGGHVWLYSGGTCMVLFRGGMHGFIWGVRGFIWGAYVALFGGVCVVLFGGHAWFYSGGMRGFIRGHAWFYLGGYAWFYSGGACMVFLGGVRGFFSFFRYNEIRSMSGRYASYWNAFLFFFCFLENKFVYSSLLTFSFSFS